MMNLTKSKALARLKDELADAKRMYDKFAFDPRRDLTKCNEKLHYWDGKVTGLRIAQEIMEMINRKDSNAENK